jgi:hypothetical protein
MPENENTTNEQKHASTAARPPAKKKPTPHPTRRLSLENFPFADLLLHMADAERLPIPAPAKHHFVITSCLNSQCTSPPPQLIWLLYLLLDKMIPVLLDWLKKKYGSNWPALIKEQILTGDLPW